MAIHRSGPTPAFFEYVTKKAIIPHLAPPTLFADVGLEWIEIPRFQRGISWRLDDVMELLNSNSILLGNVILGHFPRQQGQFPYLPANVTGYLYLVDGLQRFAVGTILLAILDSYVLSPTPSRPNEAAYFSGLINVMPRSAADVYRHNDREMQNHPRNAVRSQYRRLRQDLEEYIKEQFDKGKAAELGRTIVNTFVNRQIAIDAYYDFGELVNLMNTFIGINTVRVDLGPVDLLRAYIMEKASQSGWPDSDIDEIENRFTDVFVTDDKPDQELVPFASVVLKTVVEDTKGAYVFPSWPGKLDKREVSAFLDFVGAFQSLDDGNGYIAEIRRCGSIPVAILLSHYYAKQVREGSPEPSFMSGGSGENPDLHRFLIACYRRLLDGSIGRTRSFAEEIMNGTQRESLPELADRMSRVALGVNIDDKVDGQWLRTSLNKADASRSQRVFNAMLLKPKSEGYGDPSYRPLKFGKSATAFAVDHLIPEAYLHPSDPGMTEGNRLRNLAPIPSSLNSAAKATYCSQKLAGGGVYEKYLTGGTHRVHPYCQWLVHEHAPLFQSAQLDDQVFLDASKTPAIGTQRIEKIAEVLLERI